MFNHQMTLIVITDGLTLMMMMMMMMIVDLYSALRKVPLLRYVSRCVVKRNVFSADRKDSMLSE